MHKMPRGFWHYVDRWREIFPRKRRLSWRDNRLQNGYCRDCRYCCGPQDSLVPFPMALLPSQIRPDLNKDFYLLDSDTAYIGSQGCKSDTPHGCRLSLAQRPVACGLFPLVLVNGSIYLYKTCPAVLFTPLVRFADLGLEAARFLLGFNLTELRHISLDLPCETLAQNYIDLRISIFDANGKTEILG